MELPVQPARWFLRPDGQAWPRGGVGHGRPEPPAAARGPHAGAWRYAELVGRITELSAHGASATYTLAMRMVLEAQLAGEPAAWVGTCQAGFFPPDAQANGVDLAALAVVRLPDAAGLGKAADFLVRAGAFGLVVIDLAEGGKLPDRQLTRLLGLAQKHGTAIVCLTRKADALPSLGALVSLRGPVERVHLGAGRYGCTLRALKDKRRAPGWCHTEACEGPDGLR